MSVFFILLVELIQNNFMNLEKLIDKNIDESKFKGTVLNTSNQNSGERKMYIESYGCQMNFSDSEIVRSILTKEGFSTTQSINEIDLVFVNTCSIREKNNKQYVKD